MINARQVVKFLIAGGSAAAIDVIILYILTELLDLWYLASAIIAFVVAVTANFILQKIWAFGDKDSHRTRQQATYFLIAAFANLALNAGGVYLLVSVFEVWYMLAQSIMLALLAVGNFFAYKYVIFK